MDRHRENLRFLLKAAGLSDYQVEGIAHPNASDTDIIGDAVHLLKEGFGATPST